MTSRYTIRMFWSDEDEAFIAVVPDLPGCSSCGDTREECAREVEDAIEAWLEANANMGRPAPAVTLEGKDG